MQMKEYSKSMNSHIDKQDNNDQDEVVVNRWNTKVVFQIRLKSGKIVEEVLDQAAQIYQEACQPK